MDERRDTDEESRRSSSNTGHHADAEPSVKACHHRPPQSLLVIGCRLVYGHIQQSVSRPEQEQTSRQREH
jgi:hypothetical protein